MNLRFRDADEIASSSHIKRTHVEAKKLSVVQKLVSSVKETWDSSPNQPNHLKLSLGTNRPEYHAMYK